jgi:AcrR family transcriptional regulator
MPRVIKHPEIRRAEILDEALRIFLDRGYENASLNDVISEAGLSKGMFYHHFQSKQALLLALFERISDEIYEVLRPVLEEHRAEPLRRLQDMLDRSARVGLELAETTRSVFAAFHKSESSPLYDGLARTLMERFRPVLASLIHEGVAQGTFETFDPEGVAQMVIEHAIGTKELITLGLIAKSADERDEAAKRLARRLRLHALVLSRVLGLPDGALRIGKPNFARRLFVHLNPGLPSVSRVDRKKVRKSGKPDTSKRKRA